MNAASARSYFVVTRGAALASCSLLDDLVGASE
jgi:hypothetical protein